MPPGSLNDDEVARSLARKAFAAQVMRVEVDVDDDTIREGLLMVWERYGRPPGAFLRAALLVVELPGLLADDDRPRPTDYVSREDEAAAARRACTFLEELALDLS